MKKLTHDLSLEIGTWKVRIRGTTLIEDHEPKPEKPKADNRPTSVESLWVAGLFGRSSSDKWTDKEIDNYKKNKALLTPENRGILQAYYAAERAKGEGKNGGCHRRDLGTFVANLAGELDRAKAYKPMNGHHQASGRWGV